MSRNKQIQTRGIETPASQCWLNKERQMTKPALTRLGKTSKSRAQLFAHGPQYLN